jgi:transcriptional regulator with XRE-family HTH domain
MTTSFTSDLRSGCRPSPPPWWCRRVKPRGLPQEQLARLAGTSRSSISAIEHGKRDPGLEHLLKILTAAGFDLLTRIVPHDDHDDVLKASGARLDPQARRARNDAMREFADEMRSAMAHSRPLLSK